MSVLLKAAGISNSSGDAPNVEDVFSTYLYEGTGSSKTITNGIDLDDEGGMVWIKRRNHSGTNTHHIVDTERGFNKHLKTHSLDAEETYTSGYGITAFNTDGFSLGLSDGTNYSSGTYAAWTFRKAPRFFDVVTYTSNSGSHGTTTHSHSLGMIPAMIIVKMTATTGNWYVFHKDSGTSSLGSYSNYIRLNAADAGVNTASVVITATASEFTYASSMTEHSEPHVAYLFAHDPDGEDDDGMIACGSYTADTTNGVSVDLGWEPQYILIKSSSHAAHWYIVDILRGAAVGSSQQSLMSSTSASEVSYTIAHPTSTGFSIPSGTNYQTNDSDRSYIYMAIRAPMMVEPEAGSEVFDAIARTGTGTELVVDGFSTSAVDMTIIKARDENDEPVLFDRMRGKELYLRTDGTQAETEGGTTLTGFDYQNGYRLNTHSLVNGSTPYINYVFKRAKGFFDVVAWNQASDNGTTTINHSLGVTPEMIILKSRDAIREWLVYHHLVLDSSGANCPVKGIGIFSPVPSGSCRTTQMFQSIGDSSFQVDGSVTGEIGTGDYISYLFATLAGVSKCGSFTGNGSSQNIACGFSAGARFVLIKRADSNGDWYIWDTERGIVTGSDPHLKLNSYLAENDSDAIDPQSAGFTVNQNATTNVNVSSATYIFLAVA